MPMNISNLDAIAAEIAQHASSEPAERTLTCQWQGCQSPHHPTAETLYDHVCEAHIGRKSTNNLNLQCFWGACRVTTVKRDHITSHIRVHVPLKPHKCDFCGKCFKRPQDLKKHVKTHADESVLFNAPQAGAGNGRGPPNGYQAPMNGKPNGSYVDASGNHHLNYAYGGDAGNTHNNHHGYGGQPGMPGNNFAPFYAYGGPQANYPGAGLTESRKRTHDALNDFFAQAKRRQLDAGQYQDLGAQFSQFLSMFSGGVLNNANGGGGWSNNYTGGYAGGGGGGGGGGPFDHDAGMAYQTQHAPSMGVYSTPFSEVKTKSDLMSIDQFLEQLQHTVYNNADQVTAGYQPAPGPIGAGGGFQYPQRTDVPSPPFRSAATPGSSYGGPSTASNLDDTPALTPSSLQPSHSPSSTSRNLSPGARAGGGGGGLYPTLPSFGSSNNTFGVGLPNNISAAGLGPQYEDYEDRRHYPTQLQRAAPAPSAAAEAAAAAAALDDTDQKTVADMKRAMSEMDTKADETGEEGPKTSSLRSPSAKAEGAGVGSTTKTADEEAGAEGKASEDAADMVDPKLQAKEAFELNVKVIDALRAYLRARLQKGEFEGEEDGQEQGDEGGSTPRANQDVEMKSDGDEDNGEQATTPKREGASLYPMLRPVEE